MQPRPTLLVDAHHTTYTSLVSQRLCLFVDSARPKSSHLLLADGAGMQRRDQGERNSMTTTIGAILLHPACNKIQLTLFFKLASVNSNIFSSFNTVAESIF